MYSVLQLKAGHPHKIYFLRFFEKKLFKWDQQYKLYETVPLSNGSHCRYGTGTHVTIQVFI